MSARWNPGWLAVGLLGAYLSSAVVLGEEPAFRAADGARPTASNARTGAAAAGSAASLEPAGAGDQERAVTQVTKGSGVLPHDHGQQWREYDIRPYTSRVTTTARPEQAVIDWILRETGTEVWFSEPLGLLSANRDTLRVYHTAEMQKLVQEIVDRFVSSQAESEAFSLQLISVGSPNWRSRALPLMRSVPVQSAGIEAWLLSKENAVILINELRKRTDFRERNLPILVIHNGQSHTITQLRPKHYVRSVRLRENTSPGYELEMGQIEEGFSLQLSPLLSLDEQTVDAVLKCYVDQVEKLVPVAVDVPAPAGQRQSVQIQVPQLVCWRLHERFRWPAAEVLLLSCGVVATPNADRPTTLGIPNLLAGNPARADALVFVEFKGKASQTLLDPQRSAGSNSPSYRGRY